MTAMAKKQQEEARGPGRPSEGLDVSITLQVSEKMAHAVDVVAYELSSPKERVSRAEVIRRAIAEFLLKKRRK